MIYLIAFLFTTITTVVYYNYFYREDVSVALAILIHFIFFLPILLFLVKKGIELFHLNLITILGFCVGFICFAFLTNNNIWPIALVICFMLSVPSIVVLNLICFLVKKITKR